MNVSRDILERHLWTVAEYRLMGENGALPPDARVELIEGEIVDMPPIGGFHAGVVIQLTGILSGAVAGAAIVNVQNPVELSDRSEPEPDLTLLRPREDFYKRSHPLPADVLLAIEVADSTLARDRDVKRPLYARYGIPEYWIVDIADERVLTFRKPSGERYAHESVAENLRSVPITALGNVRVDLSGLFHR